MIQSLLWLTILILLVASIIDMKYRVIPNWLTLAGVILAIVLRIVFAVQDQSWGIIQEGFFGLVAGIVIGIILFYSGLWGAGDTKLLITTGILLGAEPVLSNVFFTYVINLFAISTICLLINRYFKITKFPLAPAFTLAILLTTLYGGIGQILL